MATWNVDIPAVGNVIGNEIPDIEENLQELHDVITAITNGTLGTTTAANFKVDVLAPSVIEALLPGLAVRSKFSYKDADEIYLESAAYHHHGTVEQMVYWDSQLTYTFTNLAATDWSYLYLDDSAIVTADTNLISASELVDVTTEPAWSAAKHGWYNGEDRCIFAVYTDGTPDILTFYHDGDYVLFGADVGLFANATVEDDWTQHVTLVIPKFTQRGQIEFHLNYVNGTTQGNWRTNGDTGGGHIYGGVDVNTQVSFTTMLVVTDTSQQIEIQHSADNNDTTGINGDGWYFPTGM